MAVEDLVFSRRQVFTSMGLSIRVRLGGPRTRVGMRDLLVAGLVGQEPKLKLTKALGRKRDFRVGPPLSGYGLQLLRYEWVWHANGSDMKMVFSTSDGMSRWQQKQKLFRMQYKHPYAGEATNPNAQKQM